VKYGFILPLGDAKTAAEFAQMAEVSRWDGFFVWEAVWAVDAWVSLTAAAMSTEKIRLGTMLTPLSRMRPWRVASQTATLDQLSGGRLILSVGLGAVESGFDDFGEIVDRRTRAELLDEGLDILTGLWGGQPFSYEGKHYQIKASGFPHRPPPPVQKPRIPIWVVGLWPNKKSMSRALKYDGLLPNVRDPDGSIRRTGPTTGEIEEMRAYIGTHRSDGGPFDIVVEGTTSGDDPEQAAADVEPWRTAGATWWLEAMWPASDLDEVLARILKGPPARRS
jgi:hypothetical protein